MKCTRIGLVAMTGYIVLTLAMGANAASNFLELTDRVHGRFDASGHASGGRGRGFEFFQHNRA